MTRAAARSDGIGTYSEAAGVSLEIPEDTLLNKSKVDIPMGEFWVRDLHPRLMYLQDVRGAASAAHVYGKPIVAAESFTGGGYESPFTLKKVADYWLAQGINRLVFHTSAHQPLDTKPGNTMVGTHLNRNITWAEQAAPFMTYLARSCLHAAAGPVRGRPRVPAERRRAVDDADLGRRARRRAAGGLRLRLHQRRRAAQPHVGRRETAGSCCRTA